MLDILPRLERLGRLLPVLHVAHVRALEVDERLDVLLPELEVVVRRGDTLVRVRVRGLGLGLG